MTTIKKCGVVLLGMLSLTGCAAYEADVQPQEQTSVVLEAATEEPFVLNLDGVSYSHDAAEICTSSITKDALEQLTQMTGLKQVTGTEGDGENLEQLRTYCDEHGIVFQVEVDGQMITEETTELTIPNVTENQVQLLELMPNLKRLHFPEPEASAETLLELRTKLPETVVTWEKTVLGMTFPQNAAEIDLSKVIALAEGQAFGEKTAYEYGLEFRTMGTQEEPQRTAKVLPDRPFPDKTNSTEQLVAEVEAAMEFFPEAEKLLMCGAWLDNEMMSAYRERHRGNYKVVWTVLCGDVAPRTDVTFFMPTKYYVTQGSFNDIYSYNLRYCEEIVSMDIGHMWITDIEFVRYMPKLKYFVMFNQAVSDLSPLSACKNLIFLEMHQCHFIEDYSPLVECTALEDLNIGGSSGNILPILEMKWLKNLWLVGRDEMDYKVAMDALPETNIAYYYADPDDGWRDLPNYYKMRDALLMFYME